jgi:serine/threonine protein kinase
MVKTIETFETAFDVYKVSGVLGEGGSGRVFLVSNSASEKLALKCLFPEHATTDKKKRFKNEIEFCRGQTHRNLIQVVDCGLATWEGRNTLFYVMPFFPATLRDLLKQRIAQDQVLPLFGQMLDGVEAAHLKDVIHRDLKPENFLWDPTQKLLVAADFGIAHFEEEQLYTAVETRADARLANFQYSAPEQRARGGAVDKRADIYALGLMLNEMFTGAVPHGAGFKTVAHIASQYAYLDAIIEKMIQQTREARFSSIEEIKGELIGRQNQFITLQRLDEKRREVISASAPPIVAPVRVIGLDWNEGQLILKLDRAPEPGWVNKFQHPEGNYGGIYGHGPETFRFGGNAVTVKADENIAQQLIENFKRYSDMATRSYTAQLRREANIAEQKERQRLAQEIASTEEKARMLAKLRV